MGGGGSEKTHVEYFGLGGVGDVVALDDSSCSFNLANCSSYFIR